MHHISSTRTAPGKSQAPILTKGSLVHPARPQDPVHNSYPAAAFGHDFSSIPVHAAVTIQPKLIINMPGDEYEQEADRIAEHVMRAPGQRPQHVSSEDSARVGESGPHTALRTARVEADSAGMIAPSFVYEVLSASGRPLDKATRAFMEPRFGHDFSRVRVHTDGKAAESAQAVNALAYTVGRDVVFGREQYAPAHPAGQRLLAHELTHVVQQDSFPVSRFSGSLHRQPTPTGDGYDVVTFGARGEVNLFRLAKAYGVAFSEVQRLNPGLQTVHKGDLIKLPAGTLAKSSKPPIQTGGADTSQSVPGTSVGLSNVPASPSATTAEENTSPTAEPNTVLEITGSVGAGGANKKEDVVTVQSRLRELGLLAGEGDDTLGATIVAIKDFQKYALSARVPDGRIDVPGLTQRRLKEIDSASFARLKQERQKEVDDKSSSDAAKKAAKDSAIVTKAKADNEGRELIAKHTNWGGLNLDEESLGQDLARLAITRPLVVYATISSLDASDRPQVISGIMDNIGLKTLLVTNKVLLKVMYDELAAGLTSGKEIKHLIYLRVVLGLHNQPGNEAEPDTIDLVLPVDAWMSQYSYSNDKKTNDKACKATCDLILTKRGVKNPAGGKRIFTAAENDLHTELHLTEDAKKGVAQIDAYLRGGKPIIVGVDHKLKYGYNEGTTDHFVIIVAKGKDTKVFYRFFDVGTEHPDKGTSEDNKLYLDSDGRLSGITQYNKSKYTVSQVRPNK